jgi:L-ascorbate metabolism protein UlaG (beta-lactamase superfamily)
VTDPFDETVGYPLPEVETDIATKSHDHFDHNHMSVLKGSFKVVDTAGSSSIRDIRITGVDTFHDSEEGKKRGKNQVFVFEIDKLRICHCGDLGHMPTPEQIKAIGSVDILLVPVGGIYTLDGVGAWQVVNRIMPHTAIPMHYATPGLKFELQGIEGFLQAWGHQAAPPVGELEVTVETLHRLPPILVMGH